MRGNIDNLFMREYGKTCVIKIEVIERTPKVSLSFFSVSIRDL